MAKKPLPTPEELRQLLIYDPETGNLFWRPRDASWFSDGGKSAAHCSAAWNAKNAGRAAFNALGTTGHLYGRLFRRLISAHRVAWAIEHGHWPSGHIDHINGNPTDNRIANLRDVSRTENMRNTARRVDNVSGVTGVHWNASAGKWRAQILTKSLGLFDHIEDAVAARRAAAIEHGFHENHGR